jgi:DNA-directed RNA polymerase specialized sigma24 family protein
MIQLASSNIELMRRAKNGDREAFSQLVEVNNARLYRFIAGNIYGHFDHHEVEDFQQITWLEVWMGKDKYKIIEGSDPIDWILTVDARSSNEWRISFKCGRKKC